MKKWGLGPLALAAAAVFALTAESQPPEGRDNKDRPRGGDRRGPGGPGVPGQGGPSRFELGKVIPPMMRDDLGLSDEQAKMIDELEKDVKERLSKILTADQKKKLESFRPRGSGGPGGPGGDRGGPPGDRGDRRPGDRGRPPEGRDRPGRDGPPDRERRRGDGPPPRDGGDRPERPQRDGPPPSDEDQANAGAAIPWIPTWAAGKAEALRTGKPILLVSAAPHCAGVSGIW